MAPKRASPLDEPPTASSSEEEEEESSTEEQGGSSEEEEEEQHEPAKPSSPPPQPPVEKKPASRKPLSTTTNSQPRSASLESGSESDSGSDSEEERPTVVLGLKVKPGVSKYTEETPKSKKPRSQSSATPARSTAKRTDENSRQVNDSKGTKKKSSHATGDVETPAKEKPGDESKKLFQRLWSEDDEIAILKGVIEYSAKNGADPSKDPNGFHDFIKKSLHIDVSTVQLMDKIRRLKKKYKNNAGKGKNGEDRKFSKAHDKQAFDLSKKIWGTEGTSGVAEQVKSNGKGRKDKKDVSRSRTGDSLKAELPPSSNSKEAGKMDIDENPSSMLGLSEMIRFDKNLGISGMHEDIMKKGWELMGASKREELEEKWKKLQVAELEIFVKRTELINDQAKLCWEAYKSSNP
ncbi:hypothetical protein L6164_036471 [Bauhinia variegata]|uniref:Uncharacterized protein n=1 Tax=Bauhinia variegata TaxID=167791 RepID=A0ACB9KH55_BAUVA|nr:hypothetical protein L6164_036471 [Bauhinia variegata]